MNEKNKNILKMAGILFVGLLLGWVLFGGNKAENAGHDHPTEVSENTIWTCSMHPQIRRSEPGKCPICGMDLIPLETNDGNTNRMAIQMTEDAMKLANIQTMLVGAREANKNVRLNGKIQVDERKLYQQPTHIPGRIEQLNINFTGEKVNRGELLAMIYSPDLVTAQEELLQANSIKNTQPELFEAAKLKLSNWKIGEGTIDKILNTRAIIQRFPITADVSGVVMSKKVEVGDYVDRGMPLYEIADLSSVWVLFDIYETDIPWVKIGDPVTYTVQSFPGETFEGKIKFIDPLIDPETRVASARVEVKNTENRLKPEMFVSGTLQSNLGKAAAQEIIVPKSAVMWTGERSIVYLKEVVQNKINFTLREVILGPSLGEAYVIKSGLQNGDEIVVNGTFTIDAASQLAGKPSMMDPQGGSVMTGHRHDGVVMPSPMQTSQKAIDYTIPISQEAKEALKPLFTAYFAMKDALTNDQMKEAQRAATEILKGIEGIDMTLFKDESHDVWMGLSSNLKNTMQQLANLKTIAEVRKAFQQISNDMISLENVFRPYGETTYVIHCPMADSNKGGDWLSTSKEIRNPYFGHSMLTCGEVIKEIK
ncbi:MAG: efflux RND transporter periplasmic adaptor subunit [Maribacter sp.]|nr:efflux RND transporter periplasmic adaptor subunit [Maribacter sp.]